MGSPEITIVVPVYNGSAHLRETIESLLSQSVRDFELLAVDDGSTDDSVEIIRSFQDARIRLIQQENGGLCHALNRGIQEARAPYIARNDQDDVSFPVRLEKQLNVMTSHPDAIGVLSFYTKFGSKHHWSNSDKLNIAIGEVTKYEPLNDGCLLASTMFILRSALQAIGGFRQEYYPTDDWDVECRLKEIGTVVVLREPLVAYRFHEAANTYRLFAHMQEKTRWTANSYGRRLQGLPELTFEQFKAVQSNDRWSRLRRYRLDASKLHMRTAGQSYLDGRYLRAATRLSAAIVLNPADIIKRLERLFRSFAFVRSHQL
jgi:glycosyltransferase involved in cell wall biosynthesis